MPKRIYEQYQPGDRVEIAIAHTGRDEWRPALVVRPDPPGIWVITATGQMWFMTNTYRIRPVSLSDETAESSQ